MPVHAMQSLQALLPMLLLLLPLGAIFKDQVEQRRHLVAPAAKTAPHSHLRIVWRADEAS